MAEKVALDKAWAEAARRCRLSPADVRMAKELGFKPRSLLKNQPSPQQPWKAPVAEWVRDLYAKRQRRRRPDQVVQVEEGISDRTPCGTEPSAGSSDGRNPLISSHVANTSSHRMIGMTSSWPG